MSFTFTLDSMSKSEDPKTNSKLRPNERNLEFTIKETTSNYLKLTQISDKKIETIWNFRFNN